MGFIFTPGLKQPTHDPRDYQYSKIVRVGKLPERFVLERYKVKDQKDRGTCWANAAAALKTRQEARNYPGKVYDFSAAYIWRRGKEIDGNTEDGSELRTPMKVLHKWGVCLENTLPYDVLLKAGPGVMFKIPKEADSEAPTFKIGAYAKTMLLDEIKAAIYREGSPILAGGLVTDTFLCPEKGGFVGLPEGTLYGGHAYLIDGWDDNMAHTYRNGVTLKGFLRFANSWGEDWGDLGYGYLPYAFLTWRSKDGITAFWDAWSSVDIILPPKEASVIKLKIGQKVALVDDEPVELDVPPKIEGMGRTMVPLRFIAEHLGWQVIWDDGTREITLLNPRKGAGA